MDKAYNFQETEDRIYEKWEDSGFFNPDNLDLPDDAPPFTVVLPPPNITDKLHLGHSSMLAIEDLMVRFHRMNGYRALWIPGTDHASIATQNVVEKKLLAEEKKTRHDLGREEFLKKVWEFVRKTQSMILFQTRKMGASLDWSREAFTLDEPRQSAVRKMFVDMYREGVIYRGERVVNWCPRCSSTLADDEIEYKEQKSPFYTFKYSADFPIAISTTRPETKLADTAVAVNPKDERYRQYIGKAFEVDFIGVPLRIKIIADRKVEMDFGTGALGVTPAHSYADWQMAFEHELAIVKAIDEQGSIRPGFGRFSGLSAKAARQAIVAELREKGLLSEEKEIENSLSICYRCATPIEPLPSRQWFIAVDKKLERLGGKSLKEKAIEAAEEGRIEFIPRRFEKRYLDWMNSLYDWCISRQIWFGHGIPAWYRKNSEASSDNPEAIKDDNYLKPRSLQTDKTQSQAPSHKAQVDGDDNDVEVYVGPEPPEGEGWVQDQDSLDTWFSSGMWTFSTLGWPDNFKGGKKLGDLARFHPTQLLETGYEIITLWVSRMIIMSLYALEEIPFEKVYLHGMVLDKLGKKMSKSKGNGIDPLDVIGKFGTDAVRLSLLIGSTPGNDIRMYEEKISGFRNFINKLWNISRYILDYKPEEETAGALPASGEKSRISLSDKWIAGKMRRLIEDATSDLRAYNFSSAGEKLREFTHDELADWYIEASKFSNSGISRELSMEILKDLLKLWHPFIPFVTEAVWEQFSDNLLMAESWPDSAKYSDISGHDDAASSEFGIIRELVASIRNARSENQIEPGRKIKAIIITKKFYSLISDNAELIKGLRTSIGELEVMKDGKKPDNSIYIALAGLDAYLIAEIDRDKERRRLEKEITGIQKQVAGIQNKLSGNDFIGKAPQAVIDKEREKLNACAAKLRGLQEQYEKM